MSNYFIGNPYDPNSLHEQYANSKDKRDIARAVILNLNAAATKERRKWENESIKSISFVSGNQYTKKQEQIYSNITKEIPLTINLLKIYLKRRVALFNARSPQMNVMPKHVTNNEKGNLKRSRLTDVIQDLVNYVLRSQKGKMKRGNALYKMSAGGMGLLKVDYDPFLKQITIDEIDFQDVYIDPSCSDMFDDAAFICITKMLPRKHVENLFGVSLADTIKETGSNRESATGLKLRNFNGRFYNPNFDTVRVTEQYESRAVITLKDGSITEYSQEKMQQIYQQSMEVQARIQNIQQQIQAVVMEMQLNGQEQTQTPEQQQAMMQVAMMQEQLTAAENNLSLLKSARIDRRIRMTIVAGTQTFIGREWLPTRTYPIIPYVEDYPGNPYPGSIGFDGQDLQRCINKSTSSIIRNAQRINSERTYIPQGKMEASDLERFKRNHSAPGGAYEIDMGPNGQQKPITEYPVPLGQDFYQIPRLMQQFMETIVGVSHVLFDSPERNPSMMDRILDIEERNEGILGEALRHISLADQKLLCVIVDYMQTYMSEKEMLNILEIDKEDVLQKRQQVQQMSQQAQQISQQVQEQLMPAYQQLQQVQPQSQEEAAQVQQQAQQIEAQIQGAQQQIEQIQRQAEALADEIKEPLESLAQLEVFKNDLDIGTYDIEVVCGSSLPSTRTAWIEILRMLRQDGVLQDPMPILERLPLPEKGKIIEREDQLRNLQAHCAQLQQQVSALSKDNQSMKGQNEQLRVKNKITRMEASNFANQASLRNKVKAQIQDSQVALQKAINDFESKLQLKEIELQKEKGKHDERLPEPNELTNSVESEFRNIFG